MKKLDYYIIIITLLLGGVFWGGMHLFRANQTPALQAEIYIGGTLVQTLPLPQQPTKLPVQGIGGQNTLLLEPDGVRIFSANCINQDCVQHAKITKTGEIIACLPNRLMVKLTGTAPEQEDGLDAVTR